MAWRLLSEMSIAKGCESPYSFVLAPSNAARGYFPGSPLAPPFLSLLVTFLTKRPSQCHNRHLGLADGGIIFRPSAFSSGSPGIIAGFQESTEAQ